MRRLIYVLLLPLLACTGEKETTTQPRSVILISIDTLRSDRVGAYGYTAARTPSIDALREDSVMFESAWAQAPLTLPSHASVFTGTRPPEHGVRDNAGFAMKDGLPTIATELKARGYATGGAISAWVLRSETGIDRGFDFWEDELHRTGNQVLGDIQRSGTDTLARSVRWIDQQNGKFLFFLHLYEPHAPYAPPAQFASMNPYDGEVAEADRLVGELVAHLRNRNLYDDALIILFSDHGEGLGDHGEDEHGILLNREAIQVPLLVKLPGGARKGTSVGHPVALSAIFETVNSLTGGSGGDRSLLSERPSAEPVYSESWFGRLHFGWSELHSVVEGSLHLIRGKRTELFDLETDAAERTDVSRDRRRDANRMSNWLTPLVVTAEPTQAVSEEDQQKLAALGYLGGPSTAALTLEDPRDAIGKFRRVREALALVRGGRHREALPMIEALIAEGGAMLDVLVMKAETLSALGRTREALEAAKAAYRLGPQSPTLPLLIADLSLQTGDLDGAVQHAELGRRTRPAAAADAIARVHLVRGNYPAALEEARRATRADPADPRLLTTLARALLARGDTAGAVAAFDKAAALVEGGAAPVRNLQQDRGVALMIARRPADAEIAFRREVRDFPDNLRAWGNLIALMEELRRPQDARAAAAEMRRLNPGPQTEATIREVYGSLRR